MLTSVKESYDRLLKSKEFSKEGYLCSLFLVSDIKDLKNSNWQIDFYNKDSDTITSYIMSENIESSPKSEVFKEENSEIEELNIKDVKITFKNAVKKAEEILKKYNEEAVKIIVVLQKQKESIWNISYLTSKFNLINIKINTKDGKLIDEKIISILSFEKE